MELRHLVSFLALADELHFGRAAARLHLAQPSLSQQIRRLERAVGATLIERTSHRVALTPAGELLRERASAILAQVDEASAAVRAVALGRAGTLRVGYNFVAGQRILPAALARLTAQVPDVAVTLVERRTGPQLAALAEHDLDVALTYGRPPSPEFAARPLATLPLVAVVGRNHPWAGKTDVSFAELADQPCVLFDRAQSPAMYDALTGAARRSGITLTVTELLNDPNATAIMAAVRPVCGFASAPRVAQPGADERITAVALRDPVPTVELFAVWRADEQRPLVRTFLDCVEAEEAGGCR
jgi:DNA-binding transcriptional LysR family regulator